MKTCSFLLWDLLLLSVLPWFGQPTVGKSHINQNLQQIDDFRTTRSFQTYTNYENLFIAGALCFIAASISSAGGIGGGGLYIPILAIVVGFDLKTASSFSAFMVTGASVANVFCSFLGKKSSADFGIVLLSQPCMLLGVSIGVICNLIFPEWLITSMFAIFLAWSTLKTFKIGIMYWRLESEEESKSGNPITECLLQGDDVFNKSEATINSELPVLETNRSITSSRMPWKKLCALVIIWLSFSLIYLLRGNKNGHSIIHIETCGVAYWAISSLQIPLAITITIWVLHTHKRKSDQILSHQEVAALTRQHLFPAMAILAGFVGGVFGIGGGTLVSPLLLQLGIPPEVTGATCSFIVFFSSTMSAFQYLLLGMKHTTTAAIFAVTCFLGSLIGLVAVQRAIKKHGRASLIIFSVGTVMALSTILLTGFGAVNVWKDYTAGNYMGMKLPC
ncbi:hypothetical protein V2J09_019351 [Rumex salicifolius]